MKKNNLYFSVFVMLIMVFFINITKAQNTISINSSTHLPESVVEIEVVITNADNFVAFQLDVPLPAGFTYVDESIALNPERIEDHDVESNIINTNTLRIISFSPDNEFFKLNSGVILTFEVNAPSATGDFVFNILEEFISDAAGNDIATGASAGTITLEKGTPVITVLPSASGITYGESLAGSELTGGSASYNGDPVTGSFDFTDDSITPDAGIYSAGITFTPSNTNVFNTVTGNVNVNVAKADPVVTTWPTASNITYGDALSESLLTGGEANVPGIFDFTNPALVLDAEIYHDIEVTFYPNDDNNYNNVADDISITVEKATASVNLSNLNQTYTGSPLSVTVTTDPPALPVDVTYNGSPDEPIVVGSYTVSAVVNHHNYEGSAGGTLIISKATPNITAWPSTTPLSYGQPLSASSFNDDAVIVDNVDGTFSFNNPSHVLNAGTYTTIAATFTPTDTHNYNIVSGNVTVTINKAIADITIANTSQVYNGSGRFVNVTTDPEGLNHDVTYDGSSDLPVIVGSYDVEVVIDDTNYSGTETATLNIAKATAEVVLSDLTHTHDGTSKAASVTTTPAGLNVIVTYDDGVNPITTDPPTDIGFYDVLATVDEANYDGSATGVLEINAKVTPNVVWPTASAITFGDKLEDSTLDGGSASTDGGVTDVPGTFAFTNPDYEPNAGTYSAGIRFTPTNTDDYNIVTGTVSVTVAKANAIVNITNLSRVYDGNPKPVTVTTDPVGKTTTVTYDGSATIPTNADSYEVIATIVDDNYQGSATETLVINKANPNIISWPTASDITYGDPLSESTLSEGDSSLPGDFDFTDPDLVLDAGEHNDVSVTFFPEDNDNYNNINQDIDITVNKATANVTLSDLSQIYTGSTLTVTVTTDPADLPVDVSYDGETDAPVEAGSYAVVATVNHNNYLGSRTGTFVIEKATPNITSWPTASELTYGDALSESTLTGGASSVPGTFAFNNPAQVLNAGTHDVPVTFTPNDADNYNTVEENVSVTVNKALAVITVTDAEQVYDGDPKSVSVATDPTGLSYIVTYDDETDVPVGVGVYDVVVTINENNYEGTKDTTLVINKAVATVEISNLIHGYDGEPKEVEVTTTPPDLNVVVTYDGETDLPIEIGEYDVVATVVEDNYEGSATATLEINDKKTPVVVWPAATEITYEEALEESDLEGGSASVDDGDTNVPGTFAFTNPTHQPNAGVYSASVRFTPDDNDLYNIVTGNVDVTVNKANPVVTNWPTASPITYGEPLSESELTGGTANVPGDFDFDDPTLIFDAGVQNVDVIFTPTDDDNFNFTRSEISITVNKALATITLSNLSQPYTGQSLSVTVTTVPAGLDVVVTYDGSENEPVNEGTYDVVATVVDDNYEGETTGTFEITEAVVYLITTEVFPVEGGTINSPDLIDGEGEFSYGEVIELTAIPNEGYVLENWSINDEVVSTDLVYSHAVVSDAHIVASFSIAPDTYSLDLIADPDDGGTVSGAGLYLEDEEVTITAVPNSDDNYVFEGWYDGEVLVSNEEEYTFNMPAEDLTYTAKFSIQPSVFNPESFNVEIFPNPSRGLVSISSEVSVKDIEIFNMAGKLVYSSQVDGYNYQLNLSGINVGMYFIRLNTENGSLTHKLQISR